MTIYVGVTEGKDMGMPENVNRVASFIDKYGKSFIVIERNGIRYIQQTTMGTTHELQTRQQSKQVPKDKSGIGK